MPYHPSRPVTFEVYKRGGLYDGGGQDSISIFKWGYLGKKETINNFMLCIMRILTVCCGYSCGGYLTCPTGLPHYVLTEIDIKNSQIRDDMDGMYYVQD